MRWQNRPSPGRHHTGVFHQIIIVVVAHRRGIYESHTIGGIGKRCRAWVSVIHQELSQDPCLRQVVDNPLTGLIIVHDNGHRRMGRPSLERPYRGSTIQQVEGHEIGISFRDQGMCSSQENGLCIGGFIGSAEMHVNVKGHVQQVACVGEM